MASTSLDVPFADDSSLPEHNSAMVPEDDNFDEEDNQAPYVAMESENNVNTPPRTVGSTSEHDEYVSLNISRESDEDKEKSVYHKTTKQLAKAYAAIMKEEAALTKTIAEIRLPGPIPESGMRDIEQTLMGDYKDNYYQEKGALFWMPEAGAFQERLKRSKVDNLNLDSTARRYRFLVPFIIKAELSPGLAFAESMLTWIHFLTLLSLLFSGSSIVASIVGGFSLFVSLTITQFWYGLSRYPSVWNNMVPRGLKGSKLDENFAEIRDICSYFCNGHNRTKPQLGAFIISLPFTFLYHFNAFLTTFAYYSSGVRKIGSTLPPPIPLSIFVTNTMMVCLWFIGGKVGLILTTATAIFNQNFYNSLLFKRSLKDFLLSFVFGNILVVQEKHPERIGSMVNGEEDGVATQKQLPSGIDVQEGKEVRSSPSLLEKEVSENDAPEVEKKKTNEADVFSLSSSANSLVEKEKESRDRLLVPVKDDGSPVESDIQSNESRPMNLDSFSRHQLQYLANINAASSEEEDTVEKKRHVLKPNSRSVMHALPEHRSGGVRYSNTRETDLNEFLNPSDIHLDIENHPGTLAFRNIINDAIAKFPMKTYTFRKHHWIMRKLHGRYFFIREGGKRRRRLGRAEIKKKCKMFHDKQTLLRSEIAGILCDLKDLRKNHTTSKSNSDHSRNSNAIPFEINEKLSGVLKKDSFHDRMDRRYVVNDSNVHSKHILETASTAKDSHVDSHVESSKESTISTLTQSNGGFTPEKSGARSTPWIRGPAEELKELNETALGGESSNLRNAINGVLEYTSWLENLNPLRESTVNYNERTDTKVQTELEDDDFLAKRQQSGILTEGTGGANTGGVDRVKDPYWHTFVEEPPRQRNFILSRFPKKETSQRELHTKERSEGGELPPSTIQWDKNPHRNVAGNGDVHPNERVRIFPLWRLALKKNKAIEASSKGTIPYHSESPRAPSFWRKKRNNEVNFDAKREKSLTPPRKKDLPQPAFPGVSPDLVERLDEENREGVSPRSVRKSALPKSQCKSVIEERQDNPMISLSPQFDELLDTIDDSFLRQWEGESLSMKDTASGGSSRYQGTNPYVKAPVIESLGYCTGNECGAFRACALPNASTDIDDDIYEHNE
ncbi:hypothetical protein IV203_031250 [Nitzschia inconspicua]|uniref:Uncharacterized protein n=1 Tax=Nitzschia inconspicua TaxID=303405 RepID=A0A9K3LUJ1_9STRA|nr:hypothetical protein IV203_031250 [Nitzschia inconspicua]